MTITHLPIEEQIDILYDIYCNNIWDHEQREDYLIAQGAAQRDEDGNITYLIPNINEGKSYPLLYGVGAKINKDERR